MLLFDANVDLNIDVNLNVYVNVAVGCGCGWEVAVACLVDHLCGQRAEEVGAYARKAVGITHTLTQKLHLRIHTELRLIQAYTYIHTYWSGSICALMVWVNLCTYDMWEWASVGVVGDTHTHTHIHSISSVQD